MDPIRKPLQGVGYIVRFNWHFYALSAAFLIGLICISRFVSGDFLFYIRILFALTLGTTFISLLVSFYVYDLSSLYTLNWAPDNAGEQRIVNIHAGFDETSSLLKSKYKNAEFMALDFYEPTKHTEVSIKRARKAYPPFPGTIQISTATIPLPANSIDKVFITLAAHEIRDEQERIVFFHELHRIVKSTGYIFVTEHLRDAANFMAYTIGFFHFLSKRSWYDTFKAANLRVDKEQKITPFITVFTLKKDGITD